MKICIYSNFAPRAKYISLALQSGAQVIGWDAEITFEKHTEPRADILAAYGWCNIEMFEAYRKAGLSYIYVDLGYWGRHHYKSEYGGFYKVILNGRHAVLQERDDKRIDDTSPKVMQWRSGGQDIIVAGMSHKASTSLGIPHLEWENNIVNDIRFRTDRNIVYRPKPSRDRVQTIYGTRYSTRFETVSDVLSNAHLLVTYHSNITIEALSYGVPIVVTDGPCQTMSGTIDCIENPYKPNNREQFIQNLSYTQWRRDEISSGSPFVQFIEDKLI